MFGLFEGNSGVGPFAPYYARRSGGAAMSRLPPYLRRHADRLRTDPTAPVWIAIGANAWQWARERERSHHIVIVCPPGEDPGSYDWRLCTGHDPALLMPAGATEGEQIRALLGALFACGVQRVLTTDGTRYLKREASHV